MTIAQASSLCTEVKKILHCFSDNIWTIKPRNVYVDICIFVHLCPLLGVDLSSSKNSSKSSVTASEDHLLQFMYKFCTGCLELVKQF